ncbi:MAG: HPr kinase/phosphatase C-terminal domain-containing protein [Pseudomonadota bacterium]
MTPAAPDAAGPALGKTLPSDRSDAAASAACTLHASAVARDGRALAITGPSGAGKSALALQMIGLGAQLVADDRLIVQRSAGGLTVAAPDPIAGLIEVRGLGLLRVPHTGPLPLAGIVDLSRDEPERLPPDRTMPLLGQNVPLYWRIEGAHFAAALLLVLSGARVRV